MGYRLVRRCINNMPESTTARQFWIQTPGQGQIVTTTLPAKQDDQVLVRTLYSCISRGTETLVFRGEVPPSQHEAMRAPFQEGEFPGPVKYGYANVGEVVAGPDSLVGVTVFCLYPHQDHYCVQATDVTPLPDGLPPSRAVLAANMETAVNAVWDSRPTVGDEIVVIGAGVVGLLSAWLCQQLPGTRVTVVDINPAKEAVAEALGLTFVAGLPSHTQADLVLHASGQPEGLASALTVAGHEATVVDLSWYGDRPVTLPLGEDFHSRRLTLRSSQVGHLHPERIPRWTRARRMSLALHLLLDPKVDALITGESPFEKLPDLLAKLSRDPRNTLCHRITY